jgi:hypothetical protein
VSLAAIWDSLRAHQQLLEGVVAELARITGLGRLIMAKGQAYRVCYPAYPRWCSDVDVFVPDDETATLLLDGMCHDLGFAMHGCKVGAGAVIKAFRHTEGHELNVGLHTGDAPSGVQALPLRLGLADPTHGRPVQMGGETLLASSPETLLLTTALRPIREGYFAVRGLNDVRCVLLREEGQLNWDDVVRTAQANALNGSLYHLLVAAERAEGRSLVPPEVQTDLRPGRSQRRLFSIQIGKGEGASRAMVGGRRVRSQRLSARVLRWVWLLRFAQRSLGWIRGTALVATDRPRLRRFYKEIEEARARPAGGLRSRNRGQRFRSLCEFRITAPSSVLGFCVGRDGHGLRASPRSLTAGLVRHLPDAGQEENLRKRSTIGSVDEQPHRCESFLVQVNRRPR